MRDLKPFLLIGLAGLFVALTKTTLAIPGVTHGQDRVINLARNTALNWFPEVDHRMLATMAKIESSNNPTAVRLEPFIGDASIGLMQTLLGTARWLAEDMGYDEFGVPDAADLLDPQKSMYFGGAFVNWLRTWNGSAHNEQWIVESYNGGPGNFSAQTRNHWSKYVAAKQELFG